MAFAIAALQVAIHDIIKIDPVFRFRVRIQVPLSACFCSQVRRLLVVWIMARRTMASWCWRSR
ncbi:hypothetical protein, partial [Saccharopolyspora sp. 6M]|uniref:hypothetical protein n=1 Tax=Saccharopolyspora sp. 6M TaxID=2877237 RepID=UPI001CD5D99B